MRAHSFVNFISLVTRRKMNSCSFFRECNLYSKTQKLAKGSLSSSQLFVTSLHMSTEKTITFFSSNMASSANEVTFCTEFRKILSKHNCVCLLKIIETKSVTLKKQNYRNLNIENKHEQPSHSNTHAKNSCDLGEWKRTWQKKNWWLL